MDIKVKHRLIGGIVLMGILAITLSIVFDNGDVQEQSLPIESSIPKPLPQPKMAQVIKANEQADIGVIAKATKTATKSKRRSVFSKTKKQNIKAEAWLIQVASFTIKKNANDLSVKIQGKGYPAYVRGIKSKKKKLYQVLVGPIVKLQDAKQMVTNLEESVKLKGILVPYEPSKMPTHLSVRLKNPFTK